MAEEQGRGTGAGRPALNIERIYSTTVPGGGARPDAGGPLPRAGVRGTGLPHERGPHGDAGAQGEPVAPAAGVTYALTVVFTPGEGQVSINLGGHEWVDAAVSGAIGLIAVPPVLLGTAYGIWKENRLDQEVWQEIEKAVSASEPETTPAAESQ